MSSENTVKSARMVFGTAGTQTAVQSTAGTATSNPYPMARSDFTVQVNAYVTASGTSTISVGAAVIWQGSNDNANWVNLSSATVTAVTSATFAGAGSNTLAVSGAVALTGQRYAYGRAQPTVTGSGGAEVWLGS